MSIQQTLAKTFMAGGLTAKGAAGIIGNAYQESGLNPASVGDGGGGLWGFTAGAISLGSLQGFAAAHGAQWTDPTIQAKFLLAHLSASDIHALNSQPTARGAAAWFMNNWERPAAATENAGRRMDGAQETYKMIKGSGGATVQQAKSRAGGKTTTQSTAPSSVSQTVSSAGTARQQALQALLTPVPVSTSTVSTSIPTLTPVKIT